MYAHRHTQPHKKDTQVIDFCQLILKVLQHLVYWNDNCFLHGISVALVVGASSIGLPHCHLYLLFLDAWVWALKVCQNTHKQFSESMKYMLQQFLRKTIFYILHFQYYYKLHDFYIYQIIVYHGIQIDTTDRHTHMQTQTHGHAHKHKTNAHMYTHTNILSVSQNDMLWVT